MRVTWLGILFVTTVFVSVSVTPVSAFDFKAIKGRLEQRGQNKLDRVERRTEGRCEAVNKRIDNRIAHYEDNYTRIEERMARITERMDKFVARLEGKGYDVTKVKADVATLTQMRETRRSLYTNFINELKETKQYDCGDSQGAFKTSLEEARMALSKWRDQVKANHDFLENTLRADIKAVVK